MSFGSRLLPRTLFGRTLATLILSFSLFAVLTFSAVVYYALAPVAKRSAADLVGLLILSAEAWHQIPPNLRKGYVETLYEEHNIWLTTAERQIEAEDYFLPYVYRVEQAFENRLGSKVPIRSETIEGRRWFWSDLNVGPEQVRVGFPRDRIETRPVTGLVVLGSIGVVLVLLTSWVLARRITRPLTGMAEAVERVGRGQLPEHLRESGARELATLAGRFNQMARQVKELLENRTTLLAGISHDLRTPLSRMRLAVEMLEGHCDPQLLHQLEQDLEHMNSLIGHSLELSHDLEAGEREPVDLGRLLDQILAPLEGESERIRWTPAESFVYPVNIPALRRIVTNLVENALRYSADAPVAVELDVASDPPEIRILDRGPGIPDSEKEAIFRPFYRLERSRSTETGGSGLGLAIVRQLADANGMGVSFLDREGGGSIARVLMEPKVRNPR